MNLAVIERMIRDGDLSRDGLRYLVECRGECEWLDYKEQLQLAHDKGLCDFTRDVLGMKNVGGGYIVVGVRDKTWEPVGLASPLPYDAKLLRDKVRKGCGLDLDVLIVHHELNAVGEQRLFALVFVRSSKKRNKRRMPSLVKQDCCPSKSFGLRSGDIYVRRGDSTVRVRCQEELEELLDDLEARADEETLAAAGQSSPFAVEDGCYKLLEKSYSTFIGRKELRGRVFNSVTQDPRIWIVNVHGPGGVGKSALVEWVTYEFYSRRQFEAIIHLSAKERMLTQTGIRPCRRSLYSLEDLLDHIIDNFCEPIPEDFQKKKQLATEILSVGSTLLVLDNMETVADGRILSFLQQLPPDTKAKALLTSRQKTGGWELAIPVGELDLEETTEFLRVKSREMGVDFPVDKGTCRKVLEISGGLPLAIQWIIGRYKIDRDIDAVTNVVISKDSPVLEFSFRNIWEKLSADARAILAVITIFDGPPTTQQITVATEWRLERVEKALAELGEVTLVTRVTQQSDGQVVYSALPITLNFARHQFADMGDFETQCRQRFQRFREQMDLQKFEVHRFAGIFQRYGFTSDNEKRAAILCSRGQSEMFSGNTDNADTLFGQARDLAPLSCYVQAMSASYELARNRVGVALDLAGKACELATKDSGALAYAILARVLDVQRDRSGRLDALKRAVGYDPSDVVLRHQLGVALSRSGSESEAVEILTAIIEEEKQRTPPSQSLLMALKTRIINLRRLGRTQEAEADLQLARDVLAEYPHLQHQARHIAELEEDNARG